MQSKNVYEGVLSFRGVWREYQARILREADTYLEDKRIHIVAAPGAGKTTLGIELIRRSGKPCLILSPRIIIQQQWLGRIRESFVSPGKRKEAEQYFSDDIRCPGLITSVTYQTLFCGMTGKSEDGDETKEKGEEEETDFSGFQLIHTLKKAGIGTICLDECHHLKSEWWKALEAFMNQIGDVTVIALTATPPYDSTPGQWERYIRMCGPVDAEITVPELVREGSLCPHQDYVWFNYPSAEEDRQVCRFRETADHMFQILMEDRQLYEIAASHKALFRYEEFCDSMLENPEYLSGLLIYCQARGIPFSGQWLRVLGVNVLPEMDEKWMGHFLQGILYGSGDCCTVPEEFRAVLEKELKAGGLLRQRKVDFLVNDKLEKMLINSSGKMNSILQIAACEHASLGENLRMLILTDYIRQEYRDAIGNPERELPATGVLPVFELLRRKGAGWRLGVLCGTRIILPDTAVEAFLEEAGSKNSGEFPAFRRLMGAEGEALGYSELCLTGKKDACIRAVTRVFERGYIQILTGTRSLLGEGWDSPCVNSLILASYVGAYVTSAQMRGRAIRRDMKHPDKVSNVWHLVCICDAKESKEKRRMGIENPELSEDYYTLKRRMEGVLGVSYDGNVIENGIERMSVISAPFTRKHVAEMNEEMAVRSGQRDTVAQQWKNALPPGGRLEIAESCAVKRKSLRRGIRFYHALAAQIICTIIQICNMIFRFLIRTGRGWENPAFFLITGLFFFCTAVYGNRIIRLFFPEKRFHALGNSVLAALREAGCITSACQVMTERSGEFTFYCWLQGGTEREKKIYADSLRQVMAPAGNQRYLLTGGRKEYYCVPEVFAGSRQKAEIFQRAMQSSMGKYRLVYTRNPSGRRVLLEARASSFFNLNDRCADQKKYVRGNLE